MYTQQTAFLLLEIDCEETITDIYTKMYKEFFVYQGKKTKPTIAQQTKAKGLYFQIFVSL